MTQITPEELAKAKEYVIQAGVKAFVEQEGMTPEAARERVEKALNSPARFHIPTMEELETMAVEYDNMTDELYHGKFAVIDEFQGTRVVEYEMMGEEGQRIVDAGETIAGSFPQGMTRDELSVWLDEKFPDDDGG